MLNRSCLVATCLLIGACLLSSGCSKAVEQGNSSFQIKPAAAADKAKTQSLAEAEKQEYSASEYERIGDLNFKRKNFETAFINYEKALLRNPKDQGLKSKRAWVLVSANLNSDAVREFNALLAKNEKDARAREGLGQAYFQMKRYDQAQEQFLKALELDPGLWRSRTYLGIIYDHTNQPRRGIQEFTAAIAVKPDCALLHNNLGMAYAQAGIYEEAVSAYRKALELGAPREKTLNNLGLALAQAGQPEQARAAFRQAGCEEQANNNIRKALLTQRAAAVQPCR